MTPRPKDHHEPHRPGRAGHEPLAEQLDDLYEAAIEAEQTLGPPGETPQEARRHLVVRVARVAAGLVVVGLGLALIPLPGPGLLLVAGGLALMSRDVPFARRWLDRVRARLPEGHDGQVAGWVVVVSAAGLLVSLGSSLWWLLGR